MEGVEVAEPRRGLHLREDVALLQPVDLVERDDDRLPEREHAPRDEAVAGADPRARVDDEEHGVDVLERRVDRLLHALGERVERALEAGEVDERELVVRPVRDPEEAAAGRVRHVEVIATFSPQSALTSVDLPTFGRPATATIPLFTGAFLRGTPSHHPLRS